MKMEKGNIHCVRPTTFDASTFYATNVVVRFADLISPRWSASIILIISHVRYAQRFSVLKIVTMSMMVVYIAITITQHNLLKDAMGAIQLF